MKVAIIEDDGVQQDTLRTVMNKSSWDVEFFRSATDFGRTNLKQFDVIVSEVELPNMSGRELLRSLASKTDAQMFLMSNPTLFIEEDKENTKIKGLLDRDDPDKLMECLAFVDTKLRILRMVEQDKGALEEVFPSNGFKIQIVDNIIQVKISDILSKISEEKLENLIKEKELKKMIISYPGLKILSSMHLNILVHIYKFFIKMGGKMVFWNETNNDLIPHQMNLCKLNLIFSTVETVEEARKLLA